MDKELLKKFLNHSIAKSDGQINISILDLSNIENNDNRYNRLIRVFKTVDSLFFLLAMKDIERGGIHGNR